MFPTLNERTIGALVNSAFARLLRGSTPTALLFNGDSMFTNELIRAAASIRKQKVLLVDRLGPAR